MGKQPTKIDTIQQLENASTLLAEQGRRRTDGRWLEDLTVDVAKLIRDWNVDGCWRWKDWPDRDRVMPKGTPAADVGIDLVARRSDDGGWIAMQAKARMLNESGIGADINSDELNKFLAAAANNEVWAERWLVVNGAVNLGGYSPEKVAMSGAPLKIVNLAEAVNGQWVTDSVKSRTLGDDCACSRCIADSNEDEPQTRYCMQAEAVEQAVRKLRDNELVDEQNIPRGEARGRIVLPCGSGKTLIALRIVEQLTMPGEMSVVLCPSIALVAQIRREFLRWTTSDLRAMAVCSDQGVAVDESGEEKIANLDDPTSDRGLERIETVKGCLVTTDSDEIADWIKQRRKSNRVSIIFGTYQSAAKVSEGITKADAADSFKVLICDEAHRTAGVRRRKKSSELEERLREFTLCHDRNAFPATYRVYQTATPRIYGDNARSGLEGRKDKSEFVVRHMDDQAMFGVELYRRSYADAVRNNWLSDYRIIAMGVGGQEATDIANQLLKEADEEAMREAEKAAAAAKAAGQQKRKPRKRKDALPTTGDYLKGMAFALAIGGAAISKDDGMVNIKSCIGFLNTVTRSKVMTRVLQSDAVREWVEKQACDPAPKYRLEHLDASSPVAKRDEAKRRLGAAKVTNPHAVLNVGIFGEGTDTPSLSAVAFLEARKSPIDVVQAVGRAMRRSENKDLGYIIVPVVIPDGVDAEQHLAISDRHEGWQELGDILQALRAHDQRIEDALPEILQIQLPPEPQLDLQIRTVVSVGRANASRLEHAVVTGSQEHAENVAVSAVSENRPLLHYEGAEPFTEETIKGEDREPKLILTHAQQADGVTETRVDNVKRYAPKAKEITGPVNVRGTKQRARKMVNHQRGQRIDLAARREQKRKEREEREQARKEKFESHVQGVLVDLEESLGGAAITMNLLEKSGLTGNRIKRDLNLLADAVNEAARHLHDETGLAAELDTHFSLDRLSAPKAGKPRADGSTIAALLWMNAAMLHQRVEAGKWVKIEGIKPLSEIKSSTEPEEDFRDSWDAITRQDFRPVIEPATLVLRAARRTRRLGGLRRALRHLAAEAELIAETYADMGTDHAGALFNKVMGDQSSDGAFFTRPPAADICARLALDALDPNNDLNWSDPDVWRDHKTTDLACGSGTLLTAVMTEMKRRAAAHGANAKHLAELQKVAVEEVIKGLDINPVSIQLAATQLISGNTEVKYRGMGLHLMPYGEQSDGTIAAGSVELLARSDVVNADAPFVDAAAQQHLDVEQTGSEVVSTGLKDHAEALESVAFEDAMEAVLDSRIVIMNPPFTARTKMGEKFESSVQQGLRRRMDSLEEYLASADPGLSEFLDKNSLGPRFAALASLCLNNTRGVFATVIPTTALTNTSGLPERLELAKRFHIHTILTCHQPVDVALSQECSLSESIVIMNRERKRESTRIISLDRLPVDQKEIDLLFNYLTGSNTATTLSDSWGEVSYWPIKLIQQGDWSGVLWRSPVLAQKAAEYVQHPMLAPLSSVGLSGHSTGQQLSNGYACSTVGTPDTFPILDSKGEAAQKSIEAHPDEYWKYKHGTPPILSKAGHLLVTAGGQTDAARLFAVASENAYVGRGWRPVTGATPQQAQATAVFINSTIGRLLIMRLGAKKLSFPTYNVEATNSLPIPNIHNSSIVSTLAACWEATRFEIVPQFRDGYVEVRRVWDQAVCDALGWDINEINELGELLHREPRVRGIAYGQWKE